MTDAPTHVLELTVALDYGQFALCSNPPAHDPDTELATLERALDGDGIAQSGSYLVVISPHQNNFALPLRVEVWASEPPDDLDAWQEAFEATALAGEDGLAYQSPTLPPTAIVVQPGRYAARITGRGFLTHGWPGSTQPGDEWRVQLWPGPELRPRRLRAWAGSA